MKHDHPARKVTGYRLQRDLGAESVSNLVSLQAALPKQSAALVHLGKLEVYPVHKNACDADRVLEKSLELTVKGYRLPLGRIKGHCRNACYPESDHGRHILHLTVKTGGATAPQLYSAIATALIPHPAASPTVYNSPRKKIELPLSGQDSEDNDPMQ